MTWNHHSNKSWNNKTPIKMFDDRSSHLDSFLRKSFHRRIYIFFCGNVHSTTDHDLTIHIGGNSRTLGPGRSGRDQCNYVLTVSSPSRQPPKRPSMSFFRRRPLLLLPSYYRGLSISQWIPSWHFFIHSDSRPVNGIQMYCHLYFAKCSQPSSATRPWRCLDAVMAQIELEVM